MRLCVAGCLESCHHCTCCREPGELIRSSGPARSLSCATGVWRKEFTKISSYHETVNHYSITSLSTSFRRMLRRTGIDTLVVQSSSIRLCGLLVYGKLFHVLVLNRMQGTKCCTSHNYVLYTFMSVIILRFFSGYR